VATDKKLPVTVVIGAVDNLTYKVMGISEKLKKITAPIGKVKSAFSVLGQESGITQLGENLAKVAKTGKEFFSKMGETILKVGLATFSAAAAVYGLVHSFSSAGDEIANTAQRLGLTTDSFQALAYAANQANVPQEEFTGAMSKFSKGIGEAAAGTGEALVGFNSLKISLRDGHGKLKSMESLLPEVADKLADLKNQNIKNAIAAKLFGREGAKLNGIFVDGAQGLEKMRAEAKRVGAVMTPEQIASAQEFDSGLKSITATLLMVRNVIGSALAPVLLELGKNLQAFILDHQEDIKSFAAAFAKDLPGILSDIGSKIKILSGIIGPMINFVGWLTERFGALNVVLVTLAAWFGPGLLSSFLAFGAALAGTIVPAILTTFNALSLLLGVVKFLAIGLASLIGWPATIAVAFTTAAIYAYNHWKRFQDLIDGIIGKVKGVFGFGTPETSLSTAQSQTPSMGSALGFSKTVDAAQRNDNQKSESVVKIDFSNLPKGTRVVTEKSGGILDLSMGYSMAGA
jgi:hypothetical protein